jgi:hypothetical protein
MRGKKDEPLFYNEDIQSPPPNVYRSDLGAEASGNQAQPPNVASQRRSHNAEPARPGAFKVDGLDNEGLEEDERTIEIGGEEQATVATHEESTIDVVARVVDTEEENRRLCEHDVIRHERDRLRQILDNAVIVTPVVPPDTDEENRDENVHANDEDLPKRDDHKCATKGWRWFAISVIFLIVVAVTVSLALVLQSEPTTQEEAFLNELLSSVSSDEGKALRITSTPQNKALHWLADDINLESHSNETIIQRYALATLYYSANGGSWSNNMLWLDSGEECSGWYGLECTTTGTATRIDLDGDNNLQGTVPPEIGLMTLLGEFVTD